MKIGPKYKIARRLGAPIFEKTQSQKYALSAEKKSKGMQRSRTDFGVQLTEKQKAKFFYGVTEKQFKNYVKKILQAKGAPSPLLFTALETRLDNALWRMGFAPTHRAARQMAAHGHIMVNGKRTYSPSLALKKGDVISVREGSKTSPLFNKETEDAFRAPSWIEVDEKKKEASIKGEPIMGETELLFDMGKVIQFYQR